jgi:hypothetical protein
VSGENSVDGDTRLETFVAELTRVAYRVALHTRTQGTWLDLELGLWKALAERVKSNTSNARAIAAGYNPQWDTK